MAPTSGLPLHIASGGGTSALSLAGLLASSSSSGAGVRLLLLGGQLRPHAPDAPPSAVGPWVKSATPLVDLAGCLGVRCGPDWFSSAETSFSSSSRDCSSVVFLPGSRSLDQLLALPLASFAL